MVRKVKPARAALEHDTVRDAERVFLDVWGENYRVRRFYERHGFVVIRDQPFVVASGVKAAPELMMVREVVSNA